MPNQFTKAEEEGKEKPKGRNQFTEGKRERHDPATRDKMRAEHAAQKLEAILKDKDASKEQIIAAAKALLPYGKSTYASILETQTQEALDEREIAANLAHLISDNPAILKPLIQADPGVKAALRSMLDGHPSVVDTQQTHRSNEDKAA